MNRFAAFDSFLAERGIPLGPMIAPDGMFDVAFTVGDALIAVDVAKPCQLPILGGDLWVLADGRLLPAYANWHVNRDIRESHDQYVDGSARETVRYLTALRQPESGEFLVVIVTDPIRYGRPTA